MEKPDKKEILKRANTIAKADVFFNGSQSITYFDWLVGQGLSASLGRVGSQEQVMAAIKMAKVACYELGRISLQKEMITENDI